MTANQVAALNYQEGRRANYAGEHIKRQSNEISREANAIKASEVERQKSRDKWEKGVAIANAVTGGIKNVGQGVGGAVKGVTSLFK